MATNLQIDDRSRIHALLDRFSAYLKTERNVSPRLY